MSIPSSPSSRILKHSPTSPSYSEYQYKRNLLDEVNSWSESKVSDWLYGQSLGRYSLAFIDHHISGSILLDLGYESLKAMDIKTVGERVRIVTAIKTLRQECYLAASLAARTPTKVSTPPPDYKYDEQFYNTKASKSTEINNSASKGLLNRSNSFSRFLSRSDSRRAQKNTTNTSSTAQLSPSMEVHSPSSLKTVHKRNSLEGGIMSVEKIKQTCVKVFGEDGQTRIVNVNNANESRVIMGKVLHKFGIDESNANHFCIFVGSSTNGEARALSDQELVEICRSSDRPEKERLILRKRHLYPTHEQFKKKGAVNQRTPLISSESLNSLSSDNSFQRLTLHNSAKTRRQLFGERPTSEAITFNLKSFFPNHNRELLETAGIKAQRLSMSRRNSSMSRSDSKINRNSVLPELVSVLGVELDNFIEEEESTEDENTEDTEDTEDEEDEDEQVDDSQTPTGDSHLTVTEYQDRSSSLSNSKDVKPIKSEKKTEEEAVAKEPAHGKTPKSLSRSWMKGSLIGRGTFGDVYLGLNPLSGELMAVKQVELPVENSATEERKKSMVVALQREIDLLKELEHENIVQYLGSKIDDSYFSIFLEYVPGGSVSGILASYGTFQEPLVKSFVRQILKGLNYLHNKDIVHRDIKGANVLVDNKGGVKITDFGISKKVEEDIIMQTQASSASHRPSLQGSIYWMAPEVVKQTLYTRKADIWSLGCMVIEMFTGDHPFPEYSQMQAIFQIGSYTAPNIPSNLSEDAQSFLRCTFKLNHEERSSAEELLEHVFLDELPTEDA